MAKKQKKVIYDYGWYKIDQSTNKISFDRLAWHELLFNSNIRRDSMYFYFMDNDNIDYNFEPTDDFIFILKKFLIDNDVPNIVINQLLCTPIMISNMYQKAIKKIDTQGCAYEHLTFPFKNTTIKYDYINDIIEERKTSYKQEFYPKYFDSENKMKFVEFTRYEGAESEEFNEFLIGISSFKNSEGKWILNEEKLFQNKLKLGKFFISNIVKEIWDDNWCTWITDINPVQKGGSGKSLIMKILGLLYCGNRSVTFDGRSINLNDNHVWSPITPNVTMMISLQDFGTDDKTSINKFLNILSGDAMAINKKNIDIQNIDPRFVPQASFSSNFLPNNLFENELIQRRIDILILSDYYSNNENKVPPKLLRWNTNFEWNLFFNQIIDMMIFSIKNKDNLIPIPEEVFTNTTLNTKSLSNYINEEINNTIDNIIKFFEEKNNIILSFKDFTFSGITKEELLKLVNDILKSRRSKYYIILTSKTNSEGKSIKFLKKRLGQKFKTYSKKNVNFDKKGYFKKKKGEEIE